MASGSTRSRAYSDAGEHVGDVGTPDDGERVPVDGAVVDGPGPVVVRVIAGDDRAADPGQVVEVVRVVGWVVAGLCGHGTEHAPALTPVGAGLAKPWRRTTASSRAYSSCTAGPGLTPSSSRSSTRSRSYAASASARFPRAASAAHQQQVPGLAQGRDLDQLAAGPLRAGQLGAAQLEAGLGVALQRADPDVGHPAAPRLRPAGLRLGQERPAGDEEGTQRGGPGPSPVAQRDRRLRRMQRGLGDLDVDPCGLRAGPESPASDLGAVQRPPPTSSWRSAR